MALSTLNNGDTGLQARTKINAAIVALSSLATSSLLVFIDNVNGNDGTADGTMAKPYATAQAAKDAAGTNKFYVFMPSSTAYDISLTSTGIFKCTALIPSTVQLNATLLANNAAIRDVGINSIDITLYRDSGATSAQWNLYDCRVVGANLDGGDGANGTDQIMPGGVGAAGNTDQPGGTGGDGLTGGDGTAGQNGGIIYCYGGIISGTLSLNGGHGGNGGNGSDGGQGGDGGPLDLSSGTDGGVGGNGGSAGSGVGGGSGGALILFGTKVNNATITSNGGGGGGPGTPGSGGAGGLPQGTGSGGAPGGAGSPGGSGDPGTAGTHEFNSCLITDITLDGTYGVTNKLSNHQNTVYSGAATVVSYGTLENTTFTA